LEKKITVKERFPLATLSKEKKEIFVPLKYDKETDTFIDPKGNRVKINVVD